MGVSKRERNLTNLRYDDNTALLADNITSPRRILHRVDTAGRIAGLNLNAKKTKVMHTSGKDSLDEMYTDITADGTVL